MKILKFYEDVLQSVGLHVTDDHKIQLLANDEYIDLTRRKGMPVYLPSNKALKSVYGTDSNGTIQQKHLIFNPLTEQLSHDGIGFDILLDSIKVSLTYNLAGFGALLFGTFKAPKTQQDLPMDLVDFITYAKDGEIPGMKGSGKPVDDTTDKNWDKLISSYKSSINKELFTITVPRTKRVNNENTREAKLVCNLYQDLLEHKGTLEKVEVNGVKIRPKDVKVFTDIIEIYLKGSDAKGVIVEGTTDTHAPGFIALMKLYYTIINRTSVYIEAMHNIDPEVARASLKSTKLSIKDIEEAPVVYKKELLQIPTEEDINKGASVANGTRGKNANVKQLHSAVQEAIPEVKQQQQEAVAQQPLPIQPNVTQQQSSGNLLLQKIQTEQQMSGMMPMGTGMYRQPMQVQMPIYPTAAPRPMQPTMPMVQPQVMNTTQVQPMPLPQQPVQQVQQVQATGKLVSRMAPGLNSPQVQQQMMWEQQQRMIQQQQMQQQMYANQNMMYQPMMPNMQPMWR